MPRGWNFFSTSMMRELDVGAGERLAVVELDAVAQLERDRLAVGARRSTTVARLGIGFRLKSYSSSPS